MERIANGRHRKELRGEAVKLATDRGIPTLESEALVLTEGNAGTPDKGF
ncbi:MAG TPA: hypothetical protein VLH40_01095 [Atribacteraceae bacterium]|nr:hypothetical protein [Atribacteraceae bacterium]